MRIISWATATIAFPLPPLTGDPLVDPTESGIVETCIMSRLNHQGSYALVPSAYASDASRLSRLMDSGRKARPGGDLLVIAESVYVSDLSY